MDVRALLRHLVDQGLVTEEDARTASTSPHDFVLALRGSLLRGEEALQAAAD